MNSSDYHSIAIMAMSYNQLQYMYLHGDRTLNMSPNSYESVDNEMTPLVQGTYRHVLSK